MFLYQKLQPGNAKPNKTEQAPVPQGARHLIGDVPSRFPEETEFWNEQEELWEFKRSEETYLLDCVVVVPRQKDSQTGALGHEGLGKGAGVPRLAWKQRLQCLTLPVLGLSGGGEIRCR